MLSSSMCLHIFSVVFFFKQKTAYEMRISDWSSDVCSSDLGTATFMILGEVCTRRCSFCDVAHGRPKPPDPAEPLHLAQTVKDMGLKYVVVTSVDRDDLRDGGAGHLVDCITAIREFSPGTKIAILTPDFRGTGRIDRTSTRLN